MLQDNSSIRVLMLLFGLLFLGGILFIRNAVANTSMAPIMLDLLAAVLLIVSVSSFLAATRQERKREKQ